MSIATNRNTHFLCLLRIKQDNNKVIQMSEKTELDRAEELQLLKERADLLGIKYSNNIGLDTLRAKVNEKLEEKDIATESVTNKASLRAKIRKEQLKLVRIRLTVMNPAKKAWRGEIFTFANSVIGTVKKFVPYGPKFYTNGYHVPYCIYSLLKEKQFLDINTTTDKEGKINVTTQLVPEFSIEVLPNLTQEELDKLAMEQAAGNRLEDN